jgi:hypothetical protein
MRTREGIAAVRDILSRLGLEPSAAGAATVSVIMEEKRFRGLFGSKASKEAALHAAPLSVPETLKDCVLSVSVAPEHMYM